MEHGEEQKDIIRARGGGMGEGARAGQFPANWREENRLMGLQLPTRKHITHPVHKKVVKRFFFSLFAFVSYDFF